MSFSWPLALVALAAMPVLTDPQAAENLQLLEPV